VAKKVKAVITLQIQAGKANPAPPIGPALAQHGVNIMVPAEITIYQDSSFRFKLKSPPAAILLCKAAGIEKGSGEPNREKVGSVTRSQVREIAEQKFKDMNAIDIDGAMRQIEGTAKNMGIEVVED